MLFFWEYILSQMSHLKDFLVFRRWGIVSSSCVCFVVVVVVLLSCRLQFQLFQLDSLSKRDLSLVVMCKSFASHVQVVCKSCASHVQVMCKSCASHCKSCASHVQVSVLCLKCYNFIMSIIFHNETNTLLEPRYLAVKKITLDLKRVKINYIFIMSKKFL